MSSQDHKPKRFRWYHWTALAALAAALALGIPWLYEQTLGRRDPQPRDMDYRTIWEREDQGSPDTAALLRNYRRKLYDTPYEDYELTRVMDESLMGEKLMDVTAQGAWIYYGTAPDGKLTPLRMPAADEIQQLPAEVYAIRGVDPDLAVCVRFLEAGDALTTDHVYTFLSPRLSFVTLSAFWESFDAARRLHLLSSQEFPSARLSRIHQQDILVSSYYLTPDLANALRDMFLAAQGEWLEAEADDLYVNCQKQLQLPLELDGAFTGHLTLYENGYLRFTVEDTLYNPVTPLLCRVAADKAAAIIQTVESQARLFVPDEQGTIIATTADITH